MTNCRSSYILDITLLCLIIAPCFLLFIGNMPLHNPDEARYSLVSFQMFNEHQYLVPKLSGVGFLDKPPLFYYAQILMLKVFGNSELILRLPSVLCGLLSCMVVYFTSRNLFNRTTAWYAALILASMPLFFAMSHYANLDMMVSTFISCCLCFFILAQQSDKPKKHMRIAYLFMACAMLTKGLIAVAFPCCIVVIYCFIYRVKPKLFVLDGIIIFMSLVLPWFLMMHFEVKGFSYYYFIIQHFYRYLGQSFNNQQPIWFYSAIVFASSLPWLLFIKKDSLRPKDKSLGFFLIAFIFILAFFSIPSSKPIGYILPIFAPLSILAAYSLQKTATNTKFIVLATVSIIIGLALCYPWQLLRIYNHEIIPFALILALSGSIGLLIQLLFSSTTKPEQSKLKQKYFIGLIFTTLMIFNLNGLLYVQAIDYQTIKPIANYLKKHNKNKASLAMYYQFYYDLAYYAPQQNIFAVDNWQKGLFKGDQLTEQFALGMQYHTPKNFINNKQFLSRWNNTKELLYVVTNKDHANTLLNSNGSLIMNYRGIYLLKNN